MVSEQEALEKLSTLEDAPPDAIRGKDSYLFKLDEKVEDLRQAILMSLSAPRLLTQVNMDALTARGYWEQYKGPLTAKKLIKIWQKAK